MIERKLFCRLNNMHDDTVLSACADPGKELDDGVWSARLSMVDSFQATVFQRTVLYREPMGRLVKFADWVGAMQFLVGEDVWLDGDIVEEGSLSAEGKLSGLGSVGVTVRNLRSKIPSHGCRVVFSKGPKGRTLDTEVLGESSSAVVITALKIVSKYWQVA